MLWQASHMPAPPALWKPSAAFRASTNLARYVDGLSRTRGLQFSVDDYAALWQWSVDDLDAFWMSIWEHFDVQSDGDPAVALADASMPGASWFPGAELNYAEHVFRGVDDAAVAVVEAGELRATTRGHLAGAA